MLQMRSLVRESRERESCERKREEGREIQPKLVTLDVVVPVQVLQVRCTGLDWVQTSRGFQ